MRCDVSSSTSSAKKQTVDSEASNSDNLVNSDVTALLIHYRI